MSKFCALPGSVRTAVRLLATPSPVIQYNAAFLLYMLSTTKGKLLMSSRFIHTHMVHYSRNKDADGERRSCRLAL